MVDAVTVITQFGFLLFFAVVIAIVLFPVVFLFSYVYSVLKERWPKVPDVAWMLLVTFIATITVLLVLELYLNFTLPAALAAAGA